LSNIRDNVNKYANAWILIDSSCIFAERLTKRVNLFRKVEGQAQRNLSNPSQDKVLNPTSKEGK